MTPTRIRDLLSLAVIAAVATWILARSLYGSFPPVSLIAGASLYPVAVILIAMAVMVRSRMRSGRIGPGPGQLHPITVARSVALAKASGLVGAAAAGVWVGLLVHVLPMRDTVVAAAADTPGAVVGLVAGVVTAGSALWLEHCCRTPDDRPDAPTA